MLARILSVISFLSTITLIVIVNITSPSTTGPVGILAVFILLYLILLGAITGCIYWGSRLGARLAKIVEVRRPVATLSLRRSYYFASILALGPVMTLGMQSVGGAGFYEISLIAAFLIIGCIYIAKRTT